MRQLHKNLLEFVILNKLGKEIKVSVRHSHKARRISIKIEHKDVELVLPNKNTKAAYTFLLSKESWVRKKLDNVQNINSVDQSTISLFGEIHFRCSVLIQLRLKCLLSMV